MPELTLPEGAAVSAEELKKISDGLAALEKDPHASREVSIRVTLHVHNEYPKVLYRGKEERSVADGAEEEAAEAEGFGSYDHDAYTAVESD